MGYPASWELPRDWSIENEPGVWPENEPTPTRRVSPTKQECFIEYLLGLLERGGDCCVTTLSREEITDIIAALRFYRVG